jgi:hypothetical protein
VGLNGTAIAASGTKRVSRAVTVAVTIGVSLLPANDGAAAGG